VVEVLGIDPNQSAVFQLSQNVPNPFSNLTRLAYFTPREDRIELKVYNLLGELVHQESNSVPPGEHYFEFDGGGLKPGTYFYRAENSEAFFSGKLIKSR
jgi:Secretion system C-terminal sorting domain